MRFWGCVDRRAVSGSEWVSQASGSQPQRRRPLIWTQSAVVRAIGRGGFLPAEQAADDLLGMDLQTDLARVETVQVDTVANVRLHEPENLWDQGCAASVS